MITIEKEKPAKEELKLFSVEIVLTPGAKDHVQMEAKIKGHRSTGIVMQKRATKSVLSALHMKNLKKCMI